MTGGEWTRDFADLGDPPDGLEDVRPGQRIELLEDGEIVGLVEVVSVWTRGGRYEYDPADGTVTRVREDQP